MQPLRDAIKKKYGVSDQESDQVIKALTEIERYRQDATGPQVQGFRARQPGDTRGTKEVPDIGTIIGQSTNTRSRQTSATGGSSGLIGMIISIVMSLIGMFLSNRQGQGAQGGSGAVTSVLTDLLGGATTPGQAPDLGSILGGLLSSTGGTGGAGTSGNQGLDIDDMVQVLLNQSSSPTGNPGLTHPRAK